MWAVRGGDCVWGNRSELRRPQFVRQLVYVTPHMGISPITRSTQGSGLGLRAPIGQALALPDKRLPLGRQRLPGQGRRQAVAQRCAAPLTWESRPVQGAARARGGDPLEQPHRESDQTAHKAPNQTPHKINLSYVAMHPGRLCVACHRFRRVGQTARCPLRWVLPWCGLLPNRSALFPASGSPVMTT